MLPSTQEDGKESYLRLQLEKATQKRDAGLQRSDVVSVVEEERKIVARSRSAMADWADRCPHGVAKSQTPIECHAVRTSVVKCMNPLFGGSDHRGGSPEVSIKQPEAVTIANVFPHRCFLLLEGGVVAWRLTPCREPQLAGCPRKLTSFLGALFVLEKSVTLPLRCPEKTAA